MDIVKFESVKNKLIQNRNQLVLLDKEVASLYGVEPRRLKQQLKRNIDKFPEEYAYQVTDEELDMMVTQNVSPSKSSFGGNNPYVFTEKGLYMVATILKSARATEATISIIETFAKIRELSRNINSLEHVSTEKDKEQIVKRTGEILDDIIDIEPIIEDTNDEVTEIETKIEVNIGFVKVSRTTKKKRK